MKSLFNGGSFSGVSPEEETRSSPATVMCVKPLSALAGLLDSDGEGSRCRCITLRELKVLKVGQDFGPSRLLERVHSELTLGK